MNANFKDEVVFAVFERTITRLWVLCIILIVLLFGSNCAWIYYESQFEDVVTTEKVETNTSGNSKAVGIMGDDNEVNSDVGKSKDNKDNQSSPPPGW